MIKLKKIQGAKSPSWRVCVECEFAPKEKQSAKFTKKERSTKREFVCHSERNTAFFRHSERSAKREAKNLIQNFSFCGEEEINFLEKEAKNSKKSARICLHPSDESRLQNMLIAHPHGIYIHPHANLNNAKAYSAIRGCMQIIGFTEFGVKIFDVILDSIESNLTNPISHNNKPNLIESKLKKIATLRIEPRIFLLLLPLSAVCVFHEIALGPFIKAANSGGGGQNTLSNSTQDSISNKPSVQIFANFAPEQNAHRSVIDEFINCAKNLQIGEQIKDFSSQI